MDKTFALATTEEVQDDLDKVIVSTQLITQEQHFTLRGKLTERDNLQSALNAVNAEIDSITGSLKLNKEVKEK